MLCKRTSKNTLTQTDSFESKFPSVFDRWVIPIVHQIVINLINNLFWFWVITALNFISYKSLLSLAEIFTNHSFGASTKKNKHIYKRTNTHIDIFPITTKQLAFRVRGAFWVQEENCPQLPINVLFHNWWNTTSVSFSGHLLIEYWFIKLYFQCKLIYICTMSRCLHPWFS